MCMMSVVTQYGMGVDRNTWTPQTWKQFVDLTKKVEVLDEDLGEPECIDPGKAEWMREMETRMQALEAAAFRNSAFRGPIPEQLAHRVIPRDEYQRRYDLIAQHHLDHYRKHGVNPWMSQEPELRAWTVGKVCEWVAPGARVLDAGSGIGLMLQDLAAIYHATGIDVSADYVAHAVSLGLDARVGWLETIPFEDNTFDAAVCCDTLEHVQDPSRVLAELRRVVKPSGVLVARVPNGDETGVGNDSGFGFPVHLQQWDTDQLVAFLGGTLLATDTYDIELLAAVRL